MKGFLKQCSNFGQSKLEWFNKLDQKNKSLSLILIVGFLIFVLYTFIFSTPFSFIVETLTRIETGTTIKEAATILKNAHIIRSKIIFVNLIKIYGDEKGVIAGDYYFNNRENIFVIAKRLATGDFDNSPIKITILEGLTVATMARILDRHLPFFDPIKFTSLARDKEGFLFPDTYFFTSFDSEEKIVEVMANNFDRQINKLLPAITLSGRTQEEIITMASILEKEARTMETKKAIAGILWKRLDAGMRLQVDAVFTYILSKNTLTLTKEDLNIDSLYNTYRYAGLPPSPIGNPGLEAIKAALSPTPSKFWFYLSDSEGNIHYAVTHDEHVKNKNKYLR